MAEHIVCITAAGGIPLLTRTKPGCQPLSFPVVGSLNGVHMFGLNRDVKLISTLSADHRIVWKIYEDSIVLIAVAPNEDKFLGHCAQKSSNSGVELESNARNSSSTVTDAHLLRLLDNIFHALVLLTGLSELTTIQNVDRLKKDLRACHQLVDTFLDPDLPGAQEKGLKLFGGLTHSVDIVIKEDAKLLHEHLQAFVEAADSTYGCLVVNGKVVCATNKWWMLTGQELALLGRLISIAPTSVTSSDVAVYLPHSSPNIPHRLLIFTLVTGVGNNSSGGVRACVLCGPQPSLAHVQNAYVERFWGPGTNTLQKCARSENIPTQLKSSLPSALLGFLLIDADAHRCLSHISPQIGTDTSDHLKRRKQKGDRQKIDSSWIYFRLCEFYKHVVGTSFPLPDSVEDSPLPQDDLSPHAGLAHYRCMTSHKCFALWRPPYQIFALYKPEAPTFALQNLTESTLDAVCKDGALLAL
uniref:Protein fuzzy homolog n=1 Tax=Phallusia mammillata TaxID=59560 RepID=A0A6F9DDX0_9ASCI|nr:protein fuzzy homolog [Phallusia mammillata]